MSKLELQDTVASVVMKLSEGNPGAATVCMTLFMNGAQIDPYAALGGLNPLLYLDELGLCGPDIWILHKYVCDGDLVRMMAVIRGFQLGLVTRGAVRRAVDDHKGEGGPRTVFVADPEGTLKPLDPAAVLAKVREKLPKFGKKWPAANPPGPPAAAE